jgi:hypothetical protein
MKRDFHVQFCKNLGLKLLCVEFIQTMNKLIILTLLSISAVRGQTIDSIAIKPLEEPPRLKIIKIKTDSSLIETRYYQDLNSIREFNKLDAADRTYYRDYYFDTKTIKEVGVFQGGNCAGTWRYYDNKENLIKEINFESGDKKLYNKQAEPYDEILEKMKIKATVVLKSYFGEEFFNHHLKWNASDSYFYSLNNSGRWFDIPEKKPSEFLFRYFVVFDKHRRFSTIEFKLDSKGELITDDNVLGFKKCEGLNSNSFISYDQALAIGRQNGLQLETSKFFIYLSWVKPKRKKNFLGDYELIIAEFRNQTDGGQNETIENYDAVVLDPWTGKLLRQSKFQQFRHVHEYSSSVSGLIEVR